MSLGSRIKQARTKAGLTQAKLAEQAGISPKTFPQYEQDRREPKLEVVQAIARACGVRVDDLLDGDAPAKPKSRLDGLEHVLGSLLPTDGSPDAAWRSYGIVARDALSELFPHVRRLEEACRHAAVTLDRVKSALGENP